MKGQPNARSTSAVDTAIGANMRRRRVELGLSQEAFGRDLGLTFQQIQKYEMGRNRVSLARALEICRVLRISLADLTGRNGEPAVTLGAGRQTIELMRVYRDLSPSERKAVYRVAVAIAQANVSGPNPG